MFVVPARNLLGMMCPSSNLGVIGFFSAFLFWDSGFRVPAATIAVGMR